MENYQGFSRILINHNRYLGMSWKTMNICCHGSDTNCQATLLPLMCNYWACTGGCITCYGSMCDGNTMILSIGINPAYIRSYCLEKYLIWLWK